MVLDWSSDGSYTIHIHLDEDQMKAEWKAKAKLIRENVYLKVPAGKLIFSGAEYLNDPKQIKEAGPYQLERSVLVSSATIPPGNYKASVFDLDWDYDEDIEPLIKKAQGPAHRTESIVGPISGCLLFGGLIGGGAALISELVRLLEGDGFRWWMALPILAAPMALLLMKIFDSDEAFVVRREIESRFPGTIVRLERLDDDVDTSGLRGAIVSF